jgi:hypothetical protein
MHIYHRRQLAILQKSKDISTVIKLEVTRAVLTKKHRSLREDGVQGVRTSGIQE